MTAPADRIPPSISDRYEILEEIARGAMGVVYRGRHKALDKSVAIKVVLPGGSDQRFQREARLLAKVRSPYVVQVYDFDFLSDGRAILSMEWVDGGDLAGAMVRGGGRLPEPQALRWMRDTAQGMKAAAEEGIVHRDLKPSNILIDRDGQARVADFGLARAPTGPALSQSTLVVGTPYYMAPEQAEDPHSVDTRSDIYSYGATYYHALTGRPPFDGPTALAVFVKHKAEPLISPRSINTELSSRVSEILERCLAKAPDRRFQSFSDVASQLEASPDLLSPWEATDDATIRPHVERYRSRRSFYLDQNTAGALDTYEFPGGRILCLVRGDIVSQDVDAIVSSNQSHLASSVGTATDVRAAGGEVLVREIGRYGLVRPGRAVVTSGGSLKARYVFHAVTIGRVGDQVFLPSRDLISELMASCFYHADSLRIRSVAFPLLGTGGAGFSREVCLDTMFRFAAKTLLRGLICVQEVRIVIYGPFGERAQGTARYLGTVPYLDPLEWRRDKST